MGRHTFYVRDDDEPVWAKVSELAGEESTSQIIVGALKAYVASREGDPLEWLTVEVTDELDQASTKKFKGRWLILGFKSEQDAFVRNPELLRASNHDADRTAWNVAETARGQFGIWAEEAFGKSGFYVFRTLDDAETAGVPADVLSAAAKKLGIARAELLDI